MIKIEVDEGYAFDYLSIQEVKMTKNNDSDIHLGNYLHCSHHLTQQCGEELFEKIITSKYYQDLLDVNEKLFNYVVLARKNECTAKEVDDTNNERYHAKIALRENFFPDNGDVIHEKKF
jgi:hypothetical protein